LEQIAYTFLEFLLLEISGSSAAAAQRIRAAKLKGSRVAAFKSLCALLKHDQKRGLESSSALNEVNDQYDDSNYEQEMDQTAANVADKAKKPEHNQDDNYGPKHGVFLSIELNFRPPIYPELT
jgi:hypothetical protein